MNIIAMNQIFKSKYKTALCHNHNFLWHSVSLFLSLNSAVSIICTKAGVGAASALLLEVMIIFFLVGAKQAGFARAS
jgi:hypothetical protein